jgi:hypothetical protein
MLRSTATPNPGKRPTMPDDKPKSNTAPLGVGRWRCASRRPAEDLARQLRLRLFKVYYRAL